jgi:hypothetical protein
VGILYCAEVAEKRKPKLAKGLQIEEKEWLVKIYIASSKDSSQASALFGPPDTK